MPRNRQNNTNTNKSLTKDRATSQPIQHSSSLLNRKSVQQQSSQQIRSILRNVNLNEYMSTVPEAIKQRLPDKNQHQQRAGTKNNENTMRRFEESGEGSRMQAFRKKHVKFSDVVHAFSIGDGWKMSTFVEKLKSEVDQQDRSKRLRDNYPHYMTKYTPFPKGL